MQFNSVDNKVNNYSLSVPQKQVKSKSVIFSPAKLSVNELCAENIRANYIPISFRGKAPQITNAYIITGEEDDIPLMATRKNESYLIDFDSQTEVIYGIDAIKLI